MNGFISWMIGFEIKYDPINIRRCGTVYVRIQVYIRRPPENVGINKRTADIRMTSKCMNISFSLPTCWMWYRSTRKTSNVISGNRETVYLLYDHHIQNAAVSSKLTTKINQCKLVSPQKKNASWFSGWFAVNLKKHSTSQKSESVFIYLMCGHFCSLNYCSFFVIFTEGIQLYCNCVGKIDETDVEKILYNDCVRRPKKDSRA